MKKTKAGSRILESVHHSAKALHRAGLMDERTLREFDELCLSPERREHDFSQSRKNPYAARLKQQAIRKKRS